jgi:hypothetical protein
MLETKDYDTKNLIDGISFTAVGTETKSFNFNQNGIAVLQDWLDNPVTNQ